MGDDFLDLSNGEVFRANMPTNEFNEEINLLYVTITRSGGLLDVNQKLFEWLNRGRMKRPTLKMVASARGGNIP